MHPRAAALTLAAALALPAAGLPTASPESVGVSSERLRRIDSWLNGIVANKQAAGFVSLVARRGKVIHHEAYGTRGLSVSDPMPKNALFDIASMTKPITIAAALMLVEEGRIALNEPVGSLLPEFKDVRVETAPGVLSHPAQPMEVRHLFTHTSGVFTSRSRAGIYEHATLKDFMQELSRQPLRTQPGSTWLYGTSHDVLGYLVQTVSGQPLDQFVQQRILTPLAMEDTHYWPPASKDKQRAILVVRGKDDPSSASRLPASAAAAQTYIGGASGIYTSAADYFRFCQMLLDRGQAGGRRLLGPRTVDFIAHDHMPGVEFRPGQRFGLGFAVITDPAAAALPNSKGTYYWSGSQGTLFWIDPKEQLIGVLMVQLSPNPLRLRERFTSIVYSALTD